MFRLLGRLRPNLCMGLIALPLFATSVTGCISQMKTDIASSQQRLDSLEGDLDFVTGEAIPMALFAWDGDNGESGTRGAVSSWYFLFLEDATPATVYVAPALAMMLTAALGFLVGGRAQKRVREGGEVERETVK